ncbi:MAG: DinB family protein [Microlunatus sp.]|nr:DinB family protein [Microlunatus sp.]
MTITDDHGRPESPLASDEISTVVGFLEYQRATLSWKCSGLSTAGLNATVGASTMTLGGMLKHLAFYEDHWFSHRMCGNDRRPIWRDGHWDADPDWEWHSAADDSPAMLHDLWRGAVARSRDLLSETLADGGLDRMSRRNLPDGRTPSVRWIVMHMIEEYARHNGHADLIREAVDGLTGE